MKLILLNLYPNDTLAKYLLSSYVLKAYIGETLKEEDKPDIDVLNFSSLEATFMICENIIAQKPDYVGYTSYIWNIEKILDVVRLLKEKIEAIHILGGPEVSLNSISSFSRPAMADYYVIGEGERKLANLLVYLKDNKSPEKKQPPPKGVAYYDNNRINYIEDKSNITNLDEIPSIYLGGVIEDTLYARKQAFLETQRGCKYKCRYCSYHKNLSSVSYYSVERISRELEYIIREKEVSFLRILDAVFTSDLERAKEIVRCLIKLKHNGIRIPWIYWEFNYYDSDEEFIKLASDLKYKRVISNTNELAAVDRPQLYSEMLKDYTVVNCIGIQSFSNNALKAVSRPPVDIEGFKVFMDNVNRYNTVLKIDLMLGLPFETFRSYFDGLEMLLPFFEDKDHILNIHCLQILPGSELDGLCANYGIEYSKKAPHLVSSTNTISKEELALASRLSALLFRIINSPLRKYFFDARKARKITFYRLIEEIYNNIDSSGDFIKTRLLQKDLVDDVYWNVDIFREIPSQWIKEYLRTN